MMFAFEDHAANPPATWEVVKVADRCWHVRTKDDVTMEYGIKTKREAVALLTSGRLVNHYEQEGAWYAGETPPGYRTYADCRDERFRNEGFQAYRRGDTMRVVPRDVLVVHGAGAARSWYAGWDRAADRAATEAIA